LTLADFSHVQALVADIELGVLAVVAFVRLVVRR